MPAKTLTRLIDKAILPAVVLLAAKVVGAVVVSRYFGLAWDFTPRGLTYFSSTSYLRANSYSSLLMFLAVAAGLVWVLVKAHWLHETHISPLLASRLSTWGWKSYLKTTVEIYSEATVWFSYAWLTALVLGVQSYFQLCYPWVAGAALSLTLAGTVFFVWDVERELQAAGELSKEPEPREETILRFKDLSLE